MVDGNGGTLVPMDANGWPLADGMNVVWEGKGGYEMEGTYLLQFQGKSTVGHGRSGHGR